jgi:hypothetical protein
MFIRSAAFAALLLAPLAAHADTLCIVDGETLEIRDHLTDADNDYTVDDQTGAKLDWYINNEPILDHDASYTKYGLPRVVSTAELELQGWVGGVPFFKEKGGADVPDVIYLLANPKGCEVQPYQKNP